MIPPPVSPTGAGTLLKKCQLTWKIPCFIMYIKMMIKGTVITNAKNMIIPLNIPLVTFLNPIFASILVVREFCNYTFTNQVNYYGYEEQYQAQLYQC
jgi:hypothetical protein